MVYDFQKEIQDFDADMSKKMLEKIREFDTFEDFYEWLEADVNDVINGKSEQLKIKSAIRAESINAVRKRVPGDNLEARNKAMEQIDYKQRMQMTYEEIHG